MFKGRTKLNSITLASGTSLQFGDLRVRTTTRDIVIEVESAGGLTNLVKYLYLFHITRLDRPVTLIHLYSKDSPRDHAAHVEMWPFFVHLMRESVGLKFTAHLFRYNFQTPGVRDELPRACELFRSLLSANSP